MSSIGGYVYNDLNGDGIRQPNEPPINGATVSLLEWIGGSYDPISTAVSGSDGTAGHYAFAVYPGSYLLTETPAPGYAPSPNSLHTWAINQPCTPVNIDFGDH